MMSWSTANPTRTSIAKKLRGVKISYYRLKLKTQETGASATCIINWITNCNVYSTTNGNIDKNHLYYQMDYQLYSRVFTTPQMAILTKITGHLQKSEKRTSISGLLGCRTSWEKENEKDSGWTAVSSFQRYLDNFNLIYDTCQDE